MPFAKNLLPIALALVVVTGAWGAFRPDAAKAQILLPPTISKQFGTGSIVRNSNTTLTFTVGNPNQVGTLTGVGFTDALPAGLVVATPNGLAGTCSGFLQPVVATAGGTNISLVNGTFAAGFSCPSR